MLNVRRVVIASFFPVVCFLFTSCESSMTDHPPFGTDTHTSRHADTTDRSNGREDRHTSRVNDSSAAAYDSDARDQAQRSDHCDHSKGSPTTIDLNGDALTENGEIAIPKNADPNEYTLDAVPYSNSGQELTSADFVWGVEDAKLTTINSKAWNDNTIALQTKQDFFDANAVEPKSFISVCALDPCDAHLSLDRRQSACDTATVVGLINVEGLWIIRGDILFSDLSLMIYQHGRTITTVPDHHASISAHLYKNRIRLNVNDIRYECLLTSRTHCDGTATHLTTGDLIGTWTAIKS